MPPPCSSLHDMDSSLTHIGFDLRLGFKITRLGLKLALMRLLICAVKSQVMLWVLFTSCYGCCSRLHLVLLHIKRVFSQDGLIIKPNRSSMSNDELSNLIFLKRNTNKVWHVYC